MLERLLGELRKALKTSEERAKARLDRLEAARVEQLGLADLDRDRAIEYLMAENDRAAHEWRELKAKVDPDEWRSSVSILSTITESVCGAHDGVA